MSAWLAENPTSVRERSILELGAGLGLVSIVCDRLGAARVVASEQPNALQLLQHNCLANGSSATSVAHEWGDSVEGLGLPFDLVLVSDCVNPIYGVESYAKLARSMRASFA